MAESLLVVLIIFVLAKAHYDNQFKALFREPSEKGETLE